MTDPLAGIPIPASRIDDDVAAVMASQSIDWDARGTIAERFETATWEQLRMMVRGGIGEPSE